MELQTMCGNVTEMGGQRRAEEDETPELSEDEGVGGDASREEKKKLKRTAILVSRTTQYVNPNPRSLPRG